MRGGRLIAADIHAYMSENLIKHIILILFITFFKKWFFLGSPLARHSKKDKEAQEHFKKVQIKTSLKIPGYVSLDSVDIWLQG